MTTSTKRPFGIGCDVGGEHAGDRLEQRALLVKHVVGSGRELALVGSQPAVLDERLVAVRAHLADRRLKVDVRASRTAPTGGPRRRRSPWCSSSAAPRRTRPRCRTGSAASSTATATRCPTGRRPRCWRREVVERQRRFAFDVYQLMPLCAGGWSVSVPPGRGTSSARSCRGPGSVENDCSNPGYGSPAVLLPVGEVPAPLSNSTRTSGSASNALSADWYVGSSWIGSAGSVTASVSGSPIADW